MTRNVGIKIARGNFIAILDDDDIALPHRLLTQNNALENDQGLGLIFSSVAWINDQLEVYEINPGLVHRGEFPKEPKQVFELLYLQGNKIQNTTIMVRKSIIQDVPYPENPWIGEDWILCLRLAALGIRMMAIPEPLVLMRRDTTTVGLMSNKEAAFKEDRQVLTIMRSWLEENNIHEYDSLHRLAFSNLLINEARARWGFRGLALIMNAISVAPNNPRAWNTLVWLLGKGIKKCQRIISTQQK